MTTKKKVGSFFLAILTLPAAILIQYLVSIPISGFAVMGMLFQSRGKEIDPIGLIDRFSELILGETFTDVLQIAYSLIVILVFWLWYRGMLGKEERTSRIKGKQIFALLIGLFLLMIGLQYLTEVVYQGIAAISPSTAEDYEELTEIAGMSDPTPMMYLYVVILGPIGEELIFRGVAMHYLKRIMPFAAANVLQAVLFGVYHMNLMQGLYTIVAGLLFGLIAQKGGRLLDSVLAHMIFNLLGLSGMLYFWADNPYFQFVWMPVMVLTLILGSMILFPEEKKTAGFSG